MTERPDHGAGCSAVPGFAEPRLTAPIIDKRSAVRLADVSVNIYRDFTTVGRLSKVRHSIGIPEAQVSPAGFPLLQKMDGKRG
jgi:hypothetical protein